MKRISIALLLLVFSVLIYAQETGKFKDPRDGKKYKTVKISNQVWMAQNLAYKASSGYWAYDDDKSNVKKYGYLYNWETATKVCPSGWHLPSESEFETLVNNYGGESDTEANYMALTPDGISGFSASFGGYYLTHESNFIGRGNFCSMWSATADGDDIASNFIVNGRNWRGEFGLAPKIWGYSVRCVQDN